VLRGITTLDNDDDNGALIHKTPYITDGDILQYPANRHYLGIQGFSTSQGTLNLFEIDERGYIGIGTENPRAKLEITDGDIYLSDISQGVIMKSPDVNAGEKL